MRSIEPVIEPVAPVASVGRIARLSCARGVLACVLAAAMVGALGGCATQYVDYTALALEPDPLTDEPYRLGSPDELLIRSQTFEAVDGERVTVQPDGTIDLPHAGRFEAAGRTRAELRAALVARLNERYADPDLEVRIERYASQRVFVRGRVARPGAQVYDGRTTAITALARAKPTKQANPRRILVLEPCGDGDYRPRARVDLEALRQGRPDASDVRLRPGEIVHVAPHPLAPGPGQHVEAPGALDDEAG